jgi:tryptophanyl-tRNA synthetase
MTKKGRLLTGYRPTGKLHIGHYVGNMQNMIRMQEEHECFFFIADWHALTTKYKDPHALKEDIREMVIGWIALGLDPKKCIIYRQSDLPAIAELHLYLSMVTPMGWLERNPTYKEQLKELGAKLVYTYGFIGYPVLQAADILIMHADMVPVGEDQLPHLELTREIARRFNNYYDDYMKEPEAILSETPRVLGTDGRKMSKSYGNAIYLSDSPEEIKKKVRKMITDPARMRAHDPGHPEVCSVFALHQQFSMEMVADIDKQCREGTRTCTDCKDMLAQRLADKFNDFRESREEYLKIPGFVEDILEGGLHHARPVAEETLHEVRRRMNIE